MTPYVAKIKKSIYGHVDDVFKRVANTVKRADIWTDGEATAPVRIADDLTDFRVSVTVQIHPIALTEKTLFDSVHEVPPKPDVRGYALSQLQKLYPFSEGAYRIPLNGLKPNSLQGALIDIFRGKGDREPYYTGYRIRTTRAKDAIFINIWKNDESAVH